MSFILTVDQPNIGDQEIYIHGLGSFGNGSHQITDEQAAEFRVINANSGFGPTDDEGNITLVSNLGPELATAVAGMYGVTLKENQGNPPDTKKESLKLTSESDSPQTSDNSGGE